MFGIMILMSLRLFQLSTTACLFRTTLCMNIFKLTWARCSLLGLLL